MLHCAAVSQAEAGVQEGHRFDSSSAGKRHPVRVVAVAEAEERAVRPEPVGQHYQAGEGMLEWRREERAAGLKGCRKPRGELLAHRGQRGEWVVAIRPCSPKVAAAVVVARIPRRAVVGDGGDQERKEGSSLNPAVQRFDREDGAKAIAELVIRQERPQLTNMPGRLQPRQALHPVRQADLVLESPVGLAEVMEEGDRGQPLDEPLVRHRHARRQAEPFAEQGLAEQRLQRRGDVGAVVDERMPFECEGSSTDRRNFPQARSGNKLHPR